MSDIRASNLDGISRGNTASRPVSASNGDLYYNTETSILEIYDGGWWLPNTAPGIPNSVIATDSSSGRAYNDGAASVAFTPSTTGGKATLYTVTSSPGSFTNTGSSSPINITGLQSSTQYTYTVTSTGPLGTSNASSASSAVTATTVPQAPTIGTATGADSSATLTFTAGSTGGATISNYKYSTDNSTYTAFSPSQNTSPLTISGLTNGSSYSFYLKAVNTNGDSAASSASNTVVIGSTTAFDSIATTTLSSNQTDITFTSGGAWTAYKHLQIRITGKTNRAAVNDGCAIYFNGDTTSSNYYTQNHEFDMRNNNTWYGAAGAGWTGFSLPGNTYASYMGVGYCDIYDINSSHNKNGYAISGFMQGGTASGQNNVTGGVSQWLNNSAITSITLSAANLFAAGTRVSLYGIKG